MREIILVRNPMSARNAGRPLVVAQSLIGTGKFIPVRNPMSASNVGRPLFVAHTLVNIREEVIQDREVNECRRLRI